MNTLLSLFLVPVLLFGFSSCSWGQGKNNSRDFKNIGLSGGGVITNIAVSPIDPDMLMRATNMGSVFLTDKGPKNWQMIHL